MGNCELRISIKDYRRPLSLLCGVTRNKNLKIQLTRVSFAASRQFWVRMNGVPSPRNGRPVSLTRLLTARRKSLVKAG